LFYFFFSSRRRHTRFSRDWSSDVCSSDLTAFIAERYLAIWSSNDGGAVAGVPYMYGPTVQFYGRPYTQGQLIAEKRAAIRQWPRSEERRVGKEGRSRSGAYPRRETSQS